MEVKKRTKERGLVALLVEVNIVFRPRFTNMLPYLFFFVDFVLHAATQKTSVLLVSSGNNETLIMNASVDTNYRAA